MKQNKQADYESLMRSAAKRMALHVSEHGTDLYIDPVNTTVLLPAKNLQHNLAASQLAQEGYEKFHLTKGGEYKEYHAGAFDLTKNKELLNEYIEKWKNERRKNIMAYNNVLQVLNNAVVDSVAQLHETTSWLNDPIWNAWLKLRAILESADQTEAAAAGKYFRLYNNYKKLQEIVFRAIFASTTTEIQAKTNKCALGLQSLLRALKSSYIKRNSRIINALEQTEELINEADMMVNV